MAGLFFIFYLSILVFLVVFLIVRFIKYLKEHDCDERTVEFYLVLISVLEIFTTIFFISFINTVVGTGNTIERKSAMCEEENVAIEESIDVTVRNYMDFEASTYGEL